MSRSNKFSKRAEQVHLVRDAINARDFEAIAHLPISPDLEFASVVAATEGEIYVGVAGLRKWAANVDATWDNFYVEVLEVREVADDQTLVTLRLTGTAKASAVPLDTRMGQVWRWRGDKVCRIDAYSDPRQALEAVGLRE